MLRWWNNPVYVWEKRRRTMRLARIGAAVGVAAVAIASLGLMGRDEDLLVWGVVALSLLTTVPPGLLLVVSWKREHGGAAFDELRATPLTLPEIMRGKLAAHVLPILPAYIVVAACAIGVVLGSNGTWDDAVSFALWLLAVTAWATAWAVRCSLLVFRLPAWASVALYAAVPALLVASLWSVLLWCWRWLPPHLEFWQVCAPYPAGALVAWGFHWRGVRRFEW